MNPSLPKLHRTISTPTPAPLPSLSPLPSSSTSITDKPLLQLNTKTSIRSCPEEHEDLKIQSLNSNLDDLFARINQLAEDVVTEQKSNGPVLKIKSSLQKLPDSGEKLKPVYVDKRVHKRSFEVTELPKYPVEESNTQIHIRQFQLGNKLGEGKFGEVIQCIHREMGMILACKKIYKSTIQEYQMEEQLLTELAILKKLSHPNIVKLFSCFTDEYHVFMMTEYVHGPSLDRMFGSEEPVVSGIVFQVIKALEYLHSKGIAHRDIKPENLLIQNGVVKLVDFGWAASFVPHKPDTFCGTLDYVSPEVVEKRKYDGSVDIWSLGILTFELLSGVVPFKDSLKHIHLSNIANCDKQKLIFPPQIEDDARDFIRRLLRKEPLLRMTLSEALRHPFVTKYPQGGLIQKDIAEFIKQT